jgi:dihydrolipoamide dehydrogenase
MYDIAIIGAGPGGYNSAERASEASLRTIIFEKKHIGGVCLNEGCIPTKTLLQSAKIYDYSKTGSKYGILFGESDYDYNKILKRKKKIVKKLTLGIKKKLESKSVEIVNEFAEIISTNDNYSTIKAGDKEYKAKHIIIASGSEALVPPIQGIENANVITNREALDLEHIPETITIVGAGVIGMEFCCLYSSMGAKVNLIEMLDKTLGNIDEDIASQLQKDMEKRGAEFHLCSKVIEIEPNKVKFMKDGESFEIKSDEILICIGRKANIQNIGLEKIGIKTENGVIKTNELCETNISNIYAIGDVNGKIQLAHTAYREGEMVINNIINKNSDKINYTNIPSVVYSNPEIACIGITEKHAIENKIEYKIVNIPMTFAGRFMVENEGMNGIFKMLVSSDQKVIGMHMYGNGSGELITIASHIIQNNMTIEQAKKIIYPHPTCSEIIREGLFEL